MTFFRQFKHLLPDARAWRLTIEKTLRAFFEGLAAGAPTDAREYIDDVYDDLLPPTTRELTEWEQQFGLIEASTDAARRLNIAAAWAETGGQSPSYIQGQLQAAGFNVFIYDWWSSASPYVPRDPRLHTNQPLIGSVRCSAFPSQTRCNSGLDAFGNPISGQGRCNAFLSNEIFYIVNDTLRNDAPPRVPDDSDFWPFFLYFASVTFPTPAQVPNDRRAEFERLVLKLTPTQNWKVLLVDYTTSGLFGPTFDDSFE